MRGRARPRPFGARRLGFARFHPVARQNFGMRLLEREEFVIDRKRYLTMQLFAAASQQRFVGRVLNQRMLELVGGIRNHTSGREAPGSVELGNIHALTCRWPPKN